MSPSGPFLRFMRGLKSEPSLVRIILTHLSGPRANEAEVMDVDSHAEVVMGPAGVSVVRLDPQSERPVGPWHARIIMVEGVTRRFVLVDLGGKAGIYVNGRRIKDAVLLRPGDVLRLGEQGAELEFRVEGPLL